MKLILLKENFDSFLQEEADRLEEGFFTDMMKRGQSWFTKSMFEPLQTKYTQVLQPVFKALEDLKAKNPNASADQIKSVLNQTIKNINLDQVTSQVIKEEMNINDKGFSKRKQYLMSAVLTIVLTLKILSMFSHVGQDINKIVEDPVKAKTGVEYKLDTDPKKAGFGGEEAWKVVKQMAGEKSDQEKNTGDVKVINVSDLDLNDAQVKSAIKTSFGDIHADKAETLNKLVDAKAPIQLESGQKIQIFKAVGQTKAAAQMHALQLSGNVGNFIGCQLVGNMAHAFVVKTIK